MNKNYTRQEILDKCKDEFKNLNTFYAQPVINYRGKTSDTGEYYTEVIAEFLCNNIDKFKNGIDVKHRTYSYKVKSHLGQYDDNSNRTEEIDAMKMFNQSKGGFIYNEIGKIIDYQTPLKASRNDENVGKIDLLAYDENSNILRILELKKSDSTETMLRCVLEGYI